MTKCRFLFLIILLLQQVASIAQVQLNTGSAIYDVPIYKYADPLSRMTLPISLNYSGGMGLRVDEVASDIGQGWGLIAGGKIIRVQGGEPDDQAEMLGSPYNITAYPAGYQSTDQDPTIGVPKNHGRYPVFAEQNKLYKPHNKFMADREMDRFILSLNGTTATFVIPKGETVGVFIGKSLLRVEVVFATGNTQPVPLGLGNARTKISSFKLTDENGIEYVFEQKSYQKILKLSPSDRSFQYKEQAPKRIKKRSVQHYSFFDALTTEIANPFIVDEWHLKSIEDKMVPNRKIIFNYTYRNVFSTMGMDYAIVKSKNKEYATVTLKRARNIVPVLTSITCPNTYAINFEYGTERLDLKGTNRLAAIRVNLGSAIVQKHALEHSYVMFTRYGTPENELQEKAARLYLVAISRFSPKMLDSDRPIRFDYYLGGSDKNDFVPPPFHHAKDAYGYYDGYLASESVPGSRSAFRKILSSVFHRRSSEYPSFAAIKGICFRNDNILVVKPGYAKNGLLKSVELAQGGQIVWEYEQNTAAFWGESQQQMVGGVHVSKTTVYDAGFSTNCNPGSGMVTQYLYTTSTGGSSLWGIERPDNKIQNETVYEPFDRKYKPIFPIPFPVKCDYNYKYPGVLQAEHAQKISGFSSVVSSPYYEVASTVLAAISTIRNISRLFYGSGVGAKIGLIIDILLNVFEFVYTCLIMGAEKNRTVEYWYNYNVYGGNPLPIQYKRVEVVHNNGQNGKTVNEFTSHDQYPVWVPTNSIFDQRQRFAPWAYGLPLRTTVFDSQGRKVQEQSKLYDFNDTCWAHGAVLCNVRELLPNTTSCNVFVKKAKAEQGSTWENGSYIALINPTDYTTTATDELLVSVYPLYTGITRLISDTQRLYAQFDDSKYAETITNYSFFDNLNFQPRHIETIFADGKRERKEIYFNMNTGFNPELPVTHQTALEKLDQLGIKTISIRVETFVSPSPHPANFSLVSQEQTELKIVAGTQHLVKPVANWVRRTNQPIPNWVGINAKKVSDFYYEDGTGILIAQSDEGNRNVRTLFDHADLLPVASVVNCGANDIIRYTSFETSNHNGWTITGASTTAGTVITGSRRLPLSGTAMVSSGLININQTYLVSLWATAAPVVKDNGITLSPQKTGPVRKNYTFYQYEIGSGSHTVTIGGTTTIDELRLYPKAARMITTSYDPLYGKTSICDENNRVVNYEYDTRGRIRLIRNDVGAILKMYEYGEKNEPNKCPAVFSSNAIWEVYQRDNCTGNTVGDYFEYHIPAGAYTSTISQVHADWLAEQALKANGQAQANSLASCIAIFYNQAMDTLVQKENCPVGTIGTWVTYSVPANKYFSTESQQDANDQAHEEMEANANGVANTTGTCITNNNPVWEGAINAALRCNNGVTEVEMRNINPNSGTYNQTLWWPLEENLNGCSAPSCTQQTDCSTVFYQYRKCINGQCENGLQIFVGCDYLYSPDTNSWMYRSYYHYEFSDATYSPVYYVDDYYECFY